VSDAVSRVYLDTFGKGPVRADTIITDDLIVTVLRDIFTVSEQMLIDGGEQDSVMATRALWQRETEGRFRDVVAGATGREIAAAISGFEIAHALATEVFVLVPVPAGTARR
jgi:uncharacterized protein YbcI